MKHIKWRIAIYSILLLQLPNLQAKTHDNPVSDSYNVVWDTPSANASESMPLGGGDIGCNLWVEEGEIMLYMQRSGSFSENGEYLKLGRLRISLSPNPFKEGINFRQELVLKDGYITLASAGIDVKAWVDIYTHSVHFDIRSDKKTEIKVAYESWRTDDKLLYNENRGRFGCFGLEGYPGEVVKKKDQIEYTDKGILFYHRNELRTLSPDIMIAQQGLEQYRGQIVNNISHLTFGGYLTGENLIAADTGLGVYCETPYKSWSLQSATPACEHHFSVATHIRQTDTYKEWAQELNRLQEKVAATKGNFKKNTEWWNAFWKRSWIVTDPQQTDPDSLLWQMGRNYQLFRYQLGCNMQGAYPTKFNGGNFTVDPVLTDPKMKHDPDWRAWGGDVFTAQNQRLVYWPMLKAGDAEGLQSQFNLYAQGLTGARLKVQEHFGHKGAIFCEYANAAGLDFAAGWGWTEGTMRKRGEELPFGHPDAKAVNTYDQPVEKGVMANGSIAYHWESQVEHAYMMLEYHRFTGQNIDQYMPFIKDALLFFDEHYQKRERMRTGKPVDANGKLVFFPSTSCESYRGAKNPADLISGIAACLEALLLIESDSVSEADKAYFNSYLGRLPGLSYETIKGDTVVKPAETYLKYQNVECPQFYPLFPFNRFDIESEQIPLFRNTWKQGTFPKDMVISWHQDGIFYARMGMVDEALNYNKKKLQDSPRRFPSFWGPGHDWVPDHNWGGSGMLGLQEMLLQTVGDKLHVLPAWPRNKDVAFKLHAPDNTTVEVVYVGGKLQKLEVLPQSRLKDVKMMIDSVPYN